MEGCSKKPRTSKSDDDSDIKPENLPIKIPNGPFLPMVIKLQINNFSVLRVSVSTGSATNILYWSTFLKMRLSESMLKQCEDAFLKDVFGNGVPVKGYIDLDTTFGKGGDAKMIKVRYIVVDLSSVYNVVIGMPALSDLHAIFSAGNLTLIYPLGDEKVGVVEADHEMANKCLEMCPCSV
jgi:hypothetical protein